MSNEEFDNLKEELMWEGSSVVMLSTSTCSIFVSCTYGKFHGALQVWFHDIAFLSCTTGSDEQKFLEASMAYVSGKPIMTNEEFDELKLRLRVLVNICAVLEN